MDLNLLLTSKVDIVNKHHDQCRIQVLYHILYLVLGFISNESVDLSCCLLRFGQVNVKDLTRVVVFDILQELLQRSEARAHCNAITDIQLLVLLVLPKHVEKMLVRFVDLSLV